MAHEPTVSAIYSAVLRTEPTEAQIAFYAAQFPATDPNWEEDLIDALLPLAQDDVYAVVRLYQASFDRLPDSAGLDFWVASYNTIEAQAGTTAALESLAAGFATSAEFTARYQGLNNEQIVSQLYMNVLNRAGDAGGIDYWTDLLNSGADFSAVVNGFAQSAEFQGRSAAFIEAFLTLAAETTYDGDDTNNDDVYQGSLFDVPGVTPPTNSLNLTDAVGETVIGTAGSDTISGVVDGTTSANGTFNVGDQVDGQGGDDTFNLLVAVGGSLPAGASVKNVETVNVTYADGQNVGALNSSTFAGVEQLWQIDTDATTNDFQNVTVNAGVTAGFRSTGTTAATAATASVIAAAGVTGVAVALDGVLSGSAIALEETTANDLSTVSVSGSVASDAGTPAVPGNDGPDGIPGNADDVAPIPAVPAGNTLTLTATAADIDTLNLAISSNSTVVVSSFVDAQALNASGSTGNLTVNATALIEAGSLKFGSGSDNVTVDVQASTADAVTIDLGAGNDVLTVNAALASAANVASTITLGAGNDTLDINGLSNINDASEAEFAAGIMTVADFDADADVLNVVSLGGPSLLDNTELADIADEASLFAAVTKAATYINADASDFGVFNFGGNAYILDTADATFNSGDGLVQLTGVSVAELDATSYITA